MFSVAADAIKDESVMSNKKIVILDGSGNGDEYLASPFPLYIDALPYLVTKAFEVIAKHKNMYVKPYADETPPS